MKKIILAAVFIFFVVVVKGQGPDQQRKDRSEPPSLEERMKKLGELMKKELNPTDKQQAAINEAYKKFFTGADKVRKDNPPPPPPPPDPKAKAALDKLEKERDEAIQKVLTPAQFEKYKEAAKKMRPPGPPPPKNQ